MDELERLRSLLLTEDPVTVEIGEDLNISSLCRTCLSDSADNNLTNASLCVISCSGKLIRVYDMYEAVTGLKIKTNDGLPKFLCSSCLKLINSSYNFRTQSQRAEQIFRSIQSAMTIEQGVNFTVLEVENHDDDDDEEEEEEEEVGEVLQLVETIKDSESNEHISPKADTEEELLDEDSMEIEELEEESEEGEPIEAVNMEASPTELSCPFCPKVYYLQRDIFNHYRLEHPKEKPFKCCQCGATFSHVQSMRRHKKIAHTPAAKEKMCPHCSRLFQRADDLKRHIRTHTDERPYPCTICEKAFKQHTELKDHMLGHMEGKMYKCALCSKELRSRNGWYLHVKMHQEGAPRRRVRKKKQAIRDLTADAETTLATALVAAT